MRLQVTDDGSNVVQYLFNERHHLLGLDLTRDNREKVVSAITSGGLVLTCTKCLRHFWAILMNVSQAMSCTPSWVSVEDVTFTKAHCWPRPLTVHELKQLVDDRLQELPVCSVWRCSWWWWEGAARRRSLPEKPWILAHNVHDIRGYDSLVVLSSLLLT